MFCYQRVLFLTTPANLSPGVVTSHQDVSTINDFLSTFNLQTQATATLMLTVAPVSRKFLPRCSFTRQWMCSVLRDRERWFEIGMGMGGKRPIWKQPGYIFSYVKTKLLSCSLLETNYIITKVSKSGVEVAFLNQLCDWMVLMYISCQIFLVWLRLLVLIHRCLPCK